MDRATILVVEAEEPVRRMLRIALVNQGYDVVEAGSGHQALQRIDLGVPDMILLDLGMPDLDGIDMARKVRRGSDVPIIALSARGDDEQQIEALDAGANDYITKPFREGVLMARIRATLRANNHAADDSTLRVGELRLDLQHRQAFLSEVEIALTPTEFRLLQVLGGEAGRVLSHRHLLREVWGPSHVGELHYLRIYIKRLREKLENDPTQPKRLLTILGVGYRLVRR